MKALRWMNKNCYLYGYMSNDFVSCSYLWFCSIHTSEFCDDSADRLQSSAYLFYLLTLSLLIVHQVIQKIMSSLEIKEFTGDLCWTFCCDVQLHLRNLAWPSNKIVQCYNILGHTMQVWDFKNFINNKQQQCFQIIPATCCDIRPLGNQVFCATFPVVWVRIRSFPLFGNISWAGWNNIPLACFIMWVATV